MRIGIDVTKAAGPRDGIGNYTRALANALIRQAREHEFFLYDLLSPVAEEAVRAAFPEAPSNAVLRIGRHPRRDALDLFHSMAWLAPEDCGRVVFTCYDLTFITHPQFHRLVNKLHSIEGCLRAALGDAHFVAISHATRRDVEEILGVARDRIDVIYPAVDARYRPVPAEEARVRLRRKLKIERPFVLSVGTIEPRKNQLRLIRAFDAMPRELSEGRELLLAGGAGWLNDELHRHISTRRNAAPVRVLVNVDDDDLVDLYSACDAFAYPSLAEGFGLPVLEALSCGAPAVTSATSSLPEVAGSAALLVDPEREDEIASALARLLSDAELAATMRVKALERARSFSWERAAQETLALYARLARASG